MAKIKISRRHFLVSTAAGVSVTALQVDLGQAAQPVTNAWPWFRRHTPIPIPTVRPTSTPVPTQVPASTPVPTQVPASTPVPTRVPASTPVPTQVPTSTPAPTQVSGARPVPALPISLAANERLVTPNGTSAGSGSLVSPWDLGSGLARIASGQTLLIADGIYIVSNGLQIGVSGATQRVTIKRATPDARPIIKRSDGGSPQLSLASLTTLDGIWIAADAKDPVDHTLNHGDDVVIQNCTFWNCYQGINEGGARRNQYLNNRFVNCGTGTLYHDIYINDAATPQGEGTLVDGHIHIGGAGYKLHLYHNPKYRTLRNNFFALSKYQIACDDSPNTWDHNILWSGAGTSDNPVYMYGAAPTVTRNLFGPHTSSAVSSGSPDKSLHQRNVFVSPLAGQWNSPEVWATSKLESFLGQTISGVDQAIQQLNTAATTKNVSQVWQDPNIESWFAVIRAVIDKYKTA